MALRHPNYLASINGRSADQLTGFIASMTITGIPAVAKGPPSSAPKQWRTIYDIGFSYAPKIALVSSTSFAYAAHPIVEGIFIPHELRRQQFCLSLLRSSSFFRSGRVMDPTRDATYERCIGHGTGRSGSWDRSQRRLRGG
jgi:hypothetical protein